MKRRTILFATALLLLSIPLIALGGDHVIDESKKPQYLFVLSAESGTYADGKLTLKNVPLVVYFSDRPNRIAGHMSVKKLVDIWGKGSDSFKADPPNATLSIFDEQGNKNAVVEISNPVQMKETVTFTADILQGSIPASFPAGTLFIDGRISGIGF